MSAPLGATIGRDVPGDMLGHRIWAADFLTSPLENQNPSLTNVFTYGAARCFRFPQVGSVWAVATPVPDADATAPAFKEGSFN